MAEYFPADKLFLIAGPCVLESDELNLRVGEALAKLADRIPGGIIYKASFDKANRSNRGAARGPGIDAGLEALDRVRRATGLPVLTDVHTPEQCAPAAKVVDVLQIPAFLCRQTDLLDAAGATGKPVNVKKGQWIQPEGMRGAVQKIRGGPNSNGRSSDIAVTERGTFFGYGDLVVDMRSFTRLREACEAPVIFDATHSVQKRTGTGRRQRRSTGIRPDSGAVGHRRRCTGAFPGDASRPGLRSKRWAEHAASVRAAIATRPRSRYLGAREPMTHKDIVERGRRVVRMETEALGEAERRIGDEFARAVEMIDKSEGRVIVSGVGKSGLVGRKIAATLTSTGTPRDFPSPRRQRPRRHWDCGSEDVAILISKSGESDEVLGLLDHLKRLGTYNRAHKRREIHARAPKRRDPGRLGEGRGVSARSGTYDEYDGALALGDALAIALLEVKGFDAKDFARLHPGGTIGKRLLTRVSDVMITDNLPTLPESATMREAVVQLAERRGIAIVTASKGAVSGVITTGDLSRLMEHEENVFPIAVTKVMNRAPKVARADELGSAVVYRMETHGIIAMPVLDGDDRIVGVIHLHDLMRAGVV